jgi:hypothetical protein
MEIIWSMVPTIVPVMFVFLMSMWTILWYLMEDTKKTFWYISLIFSKVCFVFFGVEWFFRSYYALKPVTTVSIGAFTVAFISSILASFLLLLLIAGLIYSGHSILKALRSRPAELVKNKINKMHEENAKMAGEIAAKGLWKGMTGFE